MYKQIILSFLILIICFIVLYEQCELKIIPSLILSLILWFITFYFYWNFNPFSDHIVKNFILVFLITSTIFLTFGYTLSKLIKDKRVK